jgi:hypothetical protein
MKLTKRFSCAFGCGKERGKREKEFNAVFFQLGFSLTPLSSFSLFSPERSEGEPLSKGTN